MAPTARHDVIIVGAGAAGCVAAARLSAHRARRVVLIEAGGEVPPGGTESFFDDARGHVVNGFRVGRTAGAAPTSYVLGRGIGGSAAINAMIGTCGVAEDYDHWARDLGCTGWAWRDVSATFSAMRIPLSQVPRAEWGVVDRAAVDGAAQLGIRGDVGAASLSRRDGRRVSVADAYLSPARARSNLSVRTGTTVTALLMDGDVVAGVETSTGEVIEAATVVLAAGALQTPALLLRSGFTQPGIGAGLKDHPSARLTLHLRHEPDPSRLAAATLLRWPSTLSSGATDLQLLPLNHVGVAASYGALLAAAMAVHSTGRVRVTGTETVVDENMLADERDRRRLREAARTMAALASTPAMAEVADAVYIDDRGTPLAALALDDDAALDTWLMADPGGYMHAACSCRMGPVGDPGAVVDLDGRVHGAAGLWICDASVFPDLPAANPMLPTVMVAERISTRLSAGLDR